VGDVVFSPKHACKNSWKNSTCRSLFGTCTWKKMRFLRFGQKIKINPDLVEMLRNFTNTSVKIHIEDMQSSITFVMCRFFSFFSIETCKSQLMLCQEPYLSVAEWVVINCNGGKPKSITFWRERPIISKHRIQPQPLCPCFVSSSS